MPWSRGPVNDRIEFMKLYESGLYTLSALCRMRGVSRPTAYKWKARWESEREAGMEELSRRPHHSPSKTPDDIVEKLLALKREYPHYGPVTLVDMMVDRDDRRPLAYSTAGDILARNGLVRHRRRKRRVMVASGEKPIKVTSAGHTMTADHKGQFRLGNGTLCYPLTIVDPWSRYLLAVDALSSTSTREAIRVFERVFRDYGVPEQIVTDNGTPFCNRRAVGGLTALSKWWIDIGATPTRIDPGKPQQNGTHERIHRTMIDTVLQTVRRTKRAQQQSFDDFRYEYNIIRPHRSLDRKPPATLHTPYARSYPDKILPPEYPTVFEPRQVRRSGEVKWDGERMFLSQVLAGETVGFEQASDDEWDVWYRHVIVATYQARSRKIVAAKDRDGE